jgi:hypothetical protein
MGYAPKTGRSDRAESRAGDANLVRLNYAWRPLTALRDAATRTGNVPHDLPAATSEQLTAWLLAWFSDFPDAAPPDFYRPLLPVRPATVVRAEGGHGRAPARRAAPPRAPPVAPGPLG